MNFLKQLTIFTIAIVLLGVSIKGDKGNPLAFQYDFDTRVGGPFESTNSNSRFALTDAIVQNGTFFFDDLRARFASPDVTKLNGRYFTLFTPGVSFLGLPLYILGKYFGVPQYSTYLLNTLLGLLNIYLIIHLARLLGANRIASIVSGFIFLFATNAYTYALTFTQHHGVTSVILLSLIILCQKRSGLANFILGLLLGFGILLDIPTALMFLPILLYLIKNHIVVSYVKNSYKASFKVKFLWLFIGLLPMLLVFGWYNRELTGSTTKLAQNIGRSIYPPPPVENDKEVTDSDIDKDSTKGSNLPFKTRKQLNGLYILLLSDERSWIYYSPVVMLAIFGVVIAFKEKRNLGLAGVSLAVALINIVLYSLFGDPWGGWSFGARYLIPAAAIMCIFLAVAINHFKKKLWFMVLFFILTGYSLFINLVGANTTAQIPPKVEAVNFDPPISYTYKLNFDMLKKDSLSSLVYNLWFYNRIDAYFYLYSIFSFELILLITSMYFVYRAKD